MVTSTAGKTIVTYGNGKRSTSGNRFTTETSFHNRPEDNREKGDKVMILLGIIIVVMAGYLVYALVYPEKL